MAIPFLARYGAYPAVMALVVLGVSRAPFQGVPLLWLIGVAVGGLAVVAWLERAMPFDLGWRLPDLDFAADVIHAVVNLLVMHAAVVGFVLLRSSAGWEGLWWPSDWPFIAQVFLAGLPLDLSLYVVHRLSHRYGFLWQPTLQPAGDQRSTYAQDHCTFEAAP